MATGQDTNAIINAMTKQTEVLKDLVEEVHLMMLTSKRVAASLRELNKKLEPEPPVSRIVLQGDDQEDAVKFLNERSREN